MHGPLGFDGEDYWVQKWLGNFWGQLCSHFDRIDICTPIVSSDSAGYKFYAHCPLKSSQIHVIPFPTRRYIGEAITLARKLRKSNLVFIFSGLHGIIAYFVLKIFSHKPYLFCVTGDIKELVTSAPKYQRFGRLVTLIKRFITYIERRIVNDSLFTLVVKGSPLYEQYRLIHNRVYQRVPHMDLTMADYYHRQDTCLAKPIKCLYVGRIDAPKGINYLFEAIAQLRQENHDIIVEIAGDGPERINLEHLARQMKIENLVRFLGNIPFGIKLLEVYRQADIFVCPSLSEGFPRVLYEAMSQSLPIIATTVGGIPTIMRHKENALLIPPHSSGAIANTIKRLIEDAVLRQSLIKNGQELIKPILAGLEHQDFTSQFLSLLETYYPCGSFTRT